VVVATRCLGNKLSSEGVNQHRGIPASDVIVAKLTVVIESTRKDLTVQSYEDRVMQSASCLDDLPS